MNGSMARAAGITALLALLIGCGSSPRNNHYLLTTGATHPPGGETPSLGIGPISVPEYLNRNGMVYAMQGNQLQVSATERWAEPLQSGIKRVVSINLASGLDTQNIRYFPWDPKRPPAYGVRITVLSLDAGDEQASLAAEWRVNRPATGQSVARRISNLQLPLPAGPLKPEQIAPAYSKLLEQLSELISAAIEQDMATPKQADGS